MLIFIVFNRINLVFNEFNGLISDSKDDFLTLGLQILNDKS